MCRLATWDVERDIMGPRGHEDRWSDVVHLRLIPLEALLEHYVEIATPEKNVYVPLYLRVHPSAEYLEMK